MKWKKRALKKLFITLSITTILSACLTHIACAEPIEPIKLAGIESVVATGDGLATELSIKLSSPATYTSYKTASPLRLVIDLSQVSQGNISESVIVNKGNFKTVTASRFDTDAGVLTRLEIGLIDDSEAVITTLPSNPGEIKISFPGLAGLSSNLPLKESAVKLSVADGALPETANSAPVDKAIELSTLSAISVDNSTIILAIDGSLKEFKTFRLNKPERFVVDLMNVKNGLPSRLIPLNASGIASARIGLYPDKVRVVLDAVNGSFPEATAVQVDKGVIITLDTKLLDENSHTKLTTARSEKALEDSSPSKTQAASPGIAKTEVKTDAKTTTQPVAKSDTETKAASEKQDIPRTEKPKLSSGISSIDMIDFQVVDGISRVSVKVIGEINAEHPVKTPGYVTLTIKNSTLPKKLQRSMETRSFISPVLRITPLAIKTKKGTDTKIRIATRVTVPFDFRKEGDMIFVDFKHPEGQAAEKLIIESTDLKSKPTGKKIAQSSDEEISSDLVPAVESGKPASVSHGYKGRKVTLEFADAEVRKIFQLLSEVSNKNFVLGDEVTGAISLKLVNVPWDQALDIILDTKGLDKREDGNIILIKGKGKFKSQAEEELEIKRTAAKSIELKTETFSVNYADLGDITSQFEKLKTPERGQIASDKRTSKVIVKDTPQALSDMRSLLSQLDMPERQVMIEARIVEATSTFSRNLGINWGVHQRDGSAAFLGINALDTAFGGIASAAPTSGVGTAAGGSMGISFGTLANNIKIDTRLSAAASAGMVKIISSPKVATLNHKPAKISQGQQIPYQNTTATTGAVTAFVAATLSLEVTPHINANGTIIMKIDAKNDAPGTGSPPPINTKQATTELLLKDGETTVIGGIFVDSDQESDEGVPYLMDIPFIGSLFKSNSKSKTKTELLIFITPRILGSV